MENNSGGRSTQREPKHPRMHKCIGVMVKSLIMVLVISKNQDFPQRIHTEEKQKQKLQTRINLVGQALVYPASSLGFCSQN